MKKILLYILLIFVANVAIGQVTPVGTPYPINQSLGRSASTLVSTNNIRFDQGLILGHFTDTTTANLLPYLKNYPYTIISVDTNVVLMRNWNATKWMYIPTAGQVINGDTIEYLIDVSRPEGQLNVYGKYYNGFTTYERIMFVDSAGGGGGGSINVDTITYQTRNTTVQRRLLTARFNELNISITDFGAVSGGSALTNRQAFYKAIAVAKAQGGGKIFIPSGIYRIDSTIRVDTNNIVFEGQGESSIVMATTDFGNIFHIEKSTPTTQSEMLVGSVFRSFYIDSDSTRTTGAAIYQK